MGAAPRIHGDGVVVVAAVVGKGVGGGNGKWVDGRERSGAPAAGALIICPHAIAPDISCLRPASSAVSLLSGSSSEVIR